MKKFFIVNNYNDLLSGKIIPHKVLDYMPFGTFNQIVPMPITKTNELVVSPGMSPAFPLSPLLSPQPVYANSYTTVTPLFPTLGGINSPTMFPGMSSNSMGMNMGPTPRLNYGPPIIKMSPLVNNNIPARIKIASDNNIWTLDVPYANIRDVWTYIWTNSQVNLNPTDPEVTFRFYVSPLYDYTVRTTFNKMKEIVKNIEMRYGNVRYMNPAGNMTSLTDLLLALDRYPMGPRVMTNGLF